MAASKINRTVALATYSIAFKVSHKDEHYQMDDVGGIDAFTLIKDFLTDAKSPRRDDELKAVFKTRTVAADAGERLLHGVIETGEYGYSATGVDVKTEEVKYKRTADDAELIPLSYLIVLPKDERAGLVILQRFGNVGISSHFLSALRSYVGTRISKVTIEWEPLVHPSVVDAYSHKGKAKKIKFRQWLVPKEISDSLGRKLDPRDAYIEYSIIAKRSGVLGNVAGFFDKLGRNKTAFLGLPQGFTPDDTLIEVDINGRSRTVSVNDPGNMNAFYDITSKVDFKSDGHPKEEDVQEQAQDLVDDMFQVLKGAADV